VVDDSDRDTRGSAENIAVQDNPGESRYELLLDEDVVGEVLYRWAPDHVVLLHTEVLPSLEGRGLGARLVVGALDDIRARGLHVVPFCPFVRAYIRRHPEYADLVVRHAEVPD
jgi:predicted GNAT family acetyltransferase